MSFDSFETSAASGAPIEVFKFVTASETYRYTNHTENITVNGELYFPAAVVREDIKTGTQLDDTHEINLNMAYDLPLIQNNAYTKSSPSILVTVRRVHLGSNLATDSIVLWVGRVSGFSVTDKLAKVKIASYFSTALRGNIPGVHYQNNCNHVLYDGRCKVLQGGFQTFSAITVISGNDITVTNDGVADGLLVAGIVTLQRTGESRMVINNLSNVITLASSFPEAVLGDSVIMIQGCDHSFATCGTKFSNTLNYGGHPYIPGLNPFQGEV
jgi:uncharacterized phage protein (TIGR02218 family)